MNSIKKIIFFSLSIFIINILSVINEKYTYCFLKKTHDNLFFLQSPGLSSYIALEGDLKKLRIINKKEAYQIEQFQSLLQRYSLLKDLLKKTLYIEETSLNKKEISKINKYILYLRNLNVDMLIDLKGSENLDSLFKDFSKEKLFLNPIDEKAENLYHRYLNMNFLQELSRLFKKGYRFNEIQSWKEWVISFIREKVFSIYVTDKPKVVYILDMDEEGFKIASNNSYLHFLITETGGNHIGKKFKEKDYKWISNIEMFDLDPDLILLNSKNTKFKNIHRSYISNLDAYKTKKIFIFPIGLVPWDEINIESPLGWGWLASILHPKVFQGEFSCEFIIESFYFLYNFKLSKQEFLNIFKETVNAAPLCSSEY